MVFTHIPANLLLCLVPFMPTYSGVVVVWLLRASLSYHFALIPSTPGKTPYADSIAAKWYLLLLVPLG